MLETSCTLSPSSGHELSFSQHHPANKLILSHRAFSGQQLSQHSKVRTTAQLFFFFHIASSNLPETVGNQLNSSYAHSHDLRRTCMKLLICLQVHSQFLYPPAFFRVSGSSDNSSLQDPPVLVNRYLVHRYLVNFVT
jgi:hypothetical protein